jgi:ribosomal protein L5
MSVPKLEKIVISMGLGKAAAAGEKAKIEQAEKELGVIAGQRPCVARPRRASPTSRSARARRPA